MIVGVLIIAWVVVLRIMYQKKVMEDRQKAGLVTPGPASFDMLKRQLAEVCDQLARAEDDYQQLARRTGGQHS